ncbi:hypothetical protein D3C72_1288730 [compost metagenome]
MSDMASIASPIARPLSTAASRALETAFSVAAMRAPFSATLPIIAWIAREVSARASACWRERSAMERPISANRAPSASASPMLFCAAISDAPIVSRAVLKEAATSR